MADPGLRSMGGNAPTLTPEQQPVSPPLIARLSDCPLTRAQRNRITDAIARRDYKAAETELVSEIDRQPSSTELLMRRREFSSSNGSFDVAIALKKSDHIRPLSPADRLTLALAYVA